MGIAYTGVVLSTESRTDLMKLFADEIPKNWEVISHHMTICLGSLSSSKKQKKKDLKESWKSFCKDGYCELAVVAVRRSNTVVAVEIGNVSMEMLMGPKYPHITVAVNRLAGAKPFHSNFIGEEKRTLLSEPLILSGFLKEVPHK